MAKKRKIKKKAIITIGVVVFFIIYFISFNKGLKIDTKNEKNPTENVNITEETKTTLMSQIKKSKKVYLSDESDKGISSVKIESDYWDEIKYFLLEFSEVRKPETYKTVFSGYTEDGVRFSTDLNYFRVYRVNNEEYYKVPVADKKNLQKVIKESIYTSFDFIKQYKSWDYVTINYGKESKKFSSWKYDDLSYKMAEKRMVGKVQPEKSKERSKRNFTIKIEGEGYKVNIETMGKDYVKVSCGDSTAYFEVYPRLFEYIESEVFKLTNKK